MNNNYSYTQLASKLSKRQTVKIETNTYAFKNANLVISQDTTSQSFAIVITLHGNEIAELTHNRIRLTSSGWLTSTTKDRLNKILPDNYSIKQDHGQWYLYDNRVYSYVGIFKDGLTFEPCNHPGQWVVISNTMGQDNSEIRNSILKYVKGYVAALKKGGIELPSNGDCLYCRYNFTSRLNEVSGNEHLTMHMDESYFVASLLINAINAFPVSPMGDYAIQCLMTGESLHDNFTWLVDQQIYGSLKRYMFRQFGLPT